MNIFIIPSWYPSNSSPNEGIYFKNQTEKFAEIFPSCNFCLSIWGQNEKDLLVEAKDKLAILFKIFKGKPKSYETYLRPNLTEIYTPTFTWSRKILRGNIAGIIQSNMNNFKSFEQRVGKVDIIHAFVGHPGGFVAMELSKKFKIPYLITEHMGPFPFQSYLNKKRQLSKYLSLPLEGAKKLISVSPALSETIRNFGLPSPIYIPNFVEEDIFYPKDNPSITPPFRFIICATIIYDKGIWHLLKAIEKIFDRLLYVEFIIAGGGPQFTEYKQYSNLIGVSQKITWLGEKPRAEIADILRLGHAFILPSLHENLPVAILEALATGLPIISTRCGGPEFILNEENGILIEPGDIDQLGDAILALVMNYGRFDKIKIRKDFLDNFSSKAVTSKIMRLYEEILSK